MERERLLNFYLDDAKRAGLIAGEASIFARIIAAARSAGWGVALHPPEHTPEGDGYHLIYNRAVETHFCLTLRRCHMDPFYRIEKSNNRWDWDVVNRPFRAEPAPNAASFQKRWRERLFSGHNISGQGHIFMPLQGRLRLHRHFQAMSPLEMIEATLAADPNRRIIATLHPRGDHTEAEQNALRSFGPGFDLSDRPSLAVLAACDYVVCQNSTMALTGYFANKPAVLFAGSDFHHIAANVMDQGVVAAFSKSRQDIAFRDYLYWFFKKQAISAWDDNAEAQITAVLRGHGWPI